MEIILERVYKPEETNFIFGQSHFIKTVEDIHEMLVTSVPGIQFGLAFVKPQDLAWFVGVATTRL